MSKNQKKFSKGFPSAIHKGLGFYVYVGLSKDIERELQAKGADKKGRIIEWQPIADSILKCNA
jgi:hypothetical protein